MTVGDHRSVYESIILSGTAGTEYGRRWSLALACPLCLGRPHAERSLGGLPGHSIVQRIMSTGLADFHGCQTTWILQMIVCLRDGKEAVEQLNLKAIYPQRL